MTDILPSYRLYVYFRAATNYHLACPFRTGYPVEPHAEFSYIPFNLYRLQGR